MSKIKDLAVRIADGEKITLSPTAAARLEEQLKLIKKDWVIHLPHNFGKTRVGA